MKRIVLALDLVDEPAAIAHYDRVHQPGGPPPAVAASIRAAGIRSMDIYRVANRLVMIVAADDGFDGFGAGGDAAAASRNIDVQASDAAMAQLQRPIAGSGADGWAEMRQVYRLDDQP